MLRDLADRQFNRANNTVDRAVASFIGKIETLQARSPGVFPAYIFERAALGLCTELSRLINDPAVKDTAGEATIKLANALADYRDSLFEDR